jgi:hypothetical protein
MSFWGLDSWLLGVCGVGLIWLFVVCLVVLRYLWSVWWFSWCGWVWDWETYVVWKSSLRYKWNRNCKTDLYQSVVRLEECCQT